MSGCTATVEMQFQMERLPFCNMHHAVDLIDNGDMTGLIFPDVSKAIPAWHSQQSVKITYVTPLRQHISF